MAHKLQRVMIKRTSLVGSIHTMSFKLASRLPDRSIAHGGCRKMSDGFHWGGFCRCSIV